MDVDGIVRRHFKEFLLKGPGKLMAANEIISHMELLQACGDLVAVGNRRYAAIGNTQFEQHIKSIASPDMIDHENTKAQDVKNPKFQFTKF